VDGLLLQGLGRQGVDETPVRIRGESWWLWAAFDFHSRTVLRLLISPTRSGLSALSFLLRDVLRVSTVSVGKTTLRENRPIKAEIR